MREHQYGPHRPEDAQRTVTVGEVEVPIPAALLRQREQINTLAHLAADLAGQLDCSHAEARHRLLELMGMPIAAVGA